jgi:transaldolase/glucose-6-phosphate isomerase
MDILNEVKKTGQSLWLDSLSREMLFNGTMDGMIKDLGVTGVTSNPSIFEAAILKSSYYTEPVELLAARDTTAEAIFETLEVEDIQRAADLFLGVYEETSGADGFVSVEVKPSLAYDTAKTIKEGVRLFEKIGRRNVMIKVPATPAGVLAGNALLKKGVNVNFTLIFSPDRYEDVVKAYIDALSSRVGEGLPVDRVASVASFFVSRIDTRTDEELDTLIQAEEALDVNEVRDLAASMKGRTAVANSLVAYKKYSLIFSSPEFKALQAKGARKQRILWASTGVKNPAYKDTLYSDALLLPDSINTLPESALKAFVGHGAPETAPLPARLAAAEAYFARLDSVGVDFRSILDSLEKDGVELFSRAYDSLISHLEEKKRGLEKRCLSACSKDERPLYELPNTDYAPALEKLKAMDFTARLWKKDASLWKTAPEHVKIINNSLGWLDAPFKMLARVKEIGRFRDEIIAEGFTSVVLLGMGGSSLAPEVMRTVFQRPQNPKLHVLDTTDPDWIRSVEGKLNVKKTLFIFASKSGGTIEPSSQYKHFWSLLKKAGVKKPGSNFAAITDPGTGLANLAKSKKFRKIFVNFPDIGGRFSALSYFGLVPAALCGADIKKLLERAIDTANMCKDPELYANPGVLLGALMGGLALKGRNKLTLIMPKKLEAFGLWVEQLVAESTGKEGKGVVPVVMEELSGPEGCREDRFFAHTQLGAALEPVVAAKLGKLKKAGQPVFTMFIKDEYDLGGEFFRWEAATAAAGALLGIDPFDQPNVKEAKDLTLKTLEAMISVKKPLQPEPQFETRQFSVFASKELRRELDGAAGPEETFKGLLSGLPDRDYVAILAYLPDSPEIQRELKKLRGSLHALSGAAATLSYGPRYLHSSGQLHKGGPGNACFVILTNKAKNDINITGEKYTFWQLEMAQAMGDFEALESKNSRVLRIHLNCPADKSLKSLNERISRTELTDGEEVVMKERDMIKLTAKKNGATKTAAKAKLAATNEYVLVDHPRNLENITSRHYAIRISASDANAAVDLSIDDAPWQPCRHSVGYWWYDWADFTPGTHQLVARTHLGKGEYLISKRRRCKVS